MKKLSDKAKICFSELIAILFFFSIPLTFMLPDTMLKWLCLTVGVPCFVKYLIDFLKSRTTDNFCVLSASAYILFQGLSYCWDFTVVDLFRRVSAGLFAVSFVLIFWKKCRRKV